MPTPKLPAKHKTTSMTEKQAKRELNMIKTVFNEEHLRMLRSGLCSLLDVFLEVVTDKGAQGWYNTKQLGQKLNKVEQEKWQSIKLNILEDDYNGYLKGKATLPGEKKAAELVLDLVNTFNSCKEMVMQKVDEYCSKQEEEKEKIQDREAKLEELEQELGNTKWQHRQDKVTLTSVKAAKTHLETANQEKRTLIEGLQREATVQLWVKEKERIIEKNISKLKETEEMLNKITSERDALTKKLKDLDDNMRKQKLKSEIKETKATPKSPKGIAAETQRIKQQNYLMYKDLLSLEQEIHSQQKYVVGILHGIMMDYLDTFEGPLERNETELGPYTLQRCKDLAIVSKSAWEAACKGKLGALRADLPDRYIAVDKDVKMMPIRKLSIGYFNSPDKCQAPKQNGSTTDVQETEPLSTETHPIVNGIHTDTAQTDSPQSSSREESSSENSGITPTLHKHDSMKAMGHPQFVDHKTGVINMIAVMKRFPHMKKDFVRDQWEQFCLYDKDSDYSLDFSELMAAMTSTLGNRFTGIQIQEALLEVDCDGSNDIDFYEYLSVANMLMHKEGRSEVFKNPAIQKDARHVSKTCSIQ